MRRWNLFRACANNIFCSWTNRCVCCIFANFSSLASYCCKSANPPHQIRVSARHLETISFLFYLRPDKSNITNSYKLVVTAEVPNCILKTIVSSSAVTIRKGPLSSHRPYYYLYICIYAHITLEYTKAFPFKIKQYRLKLASMRVFAIR